jgi:hypothetical protein
MMNRGSECGDGNRNHAPGTALLRDRYMPGGATPRSGADEVVSEVISVVCTATGTLTTVLMLLWAGPLFAQGSEPSVTAGVGTTALGLVDDWGIQMSVGIDWKF